MCRTAPSDPCPHVRSRRIIAFLAQPLAISPQTYGALCCGPARRWKWCPSVGHGWTKTPRILRLKLEHFEAWWNKNLTFARLDALGDLLQKDLGAYMWEEEQWWLKPIEKRAKIVVLLQAADEWLERRSLPAMPCVREAQERSRGPTASSQVLLEGQGVQRGTVGQILQHLLPCL